MTTASGGAREVRAVLFTATAAPEIRSVVDPTALIEGKTEVAHLTSDGLVLLVDEDATLKRTRPAPTAFFRDNAPAVLGMPEPRQALAVVVYGPCVVVRLRGGRFTSLSDEDLRQLPNMVAPAHWQLAGYDRSMHVRVSMPGRQKEKGDV